MNPQNLNSVISNFVETARAEQASHNQLAKEYCLEILKQKGATSKATAISFEEDDDKPCTNSCNCETTDDVASANVVRVWCDGDFIYADLDFYYQESSNDNVLIENDYEFDWITLLDYLNYFLED
jgi:hypothetical protein